ncbi:MAG: tetratricopeptide repeat protein [Magnetococcales bacterium]|nr:tetratricopeptide repeat protein [Magnetococcales bacterium]
MTEHSSPSSEDKAHFTVEEAYTQALNHYNSGSYTKADQFCTAIIKTVPNHILSINLLGLIAQQTQNHELATRLFQQAIDIDQEQESLYIHLSTSLENLGRIDEAIEALTKAIQLNNNNPISYYNLAVHLQRQDRLDEAINNYQHAIALSPDFIECRNNLGLLLLQLGKSSQAISNYEHVLALRPEDLNFHANLQQAKLQYINQYLYNRKNSGLSSLVDVESLVNTRKSNGTLKVNLLFCPFADPTTPPGGITNIKAYMAQNSSAVVNCIDLNLKFYNNFAYLEKDEDSDPFRDGKEYFKNYSDMFVDVEKYKDIATGMYDVIDIYSLSIQLALCKHDLYWQQNILNFLKPLALKDNPDVIGFSILFENQVLFSLMLAEEIKRKWPDKIIVFGGAATLNSHAEIRDNPFVDFLISDAGEHSFTELINSIQAKKLNKTIPGVAFHLGGEYIQNSAIPSDLNHEAYADYSEYQLDKYFTSEIVIPILSSKGCFWKRCSFCEEGSINKYSTASVERVVNEIQYHVENGHSYFQFVDEMISAKRLRMIAKEIIARELKVYFYATLRPSKDFNEETVELMFEAGFRYIIWGVESCNKRVLELVNKGTTVESIQNTLEISRKAGIRNHIFIIIGFPSEKPDELFETMEFIKNNIENIHLVHTSKFDVCEGTEIFSNPQKFGVSIEKVPHKEEKFITINKKDTTGYKINEYFQHYLKTFIEKIPDIYEFVRFRDHALIYYTKFPLDELANSQRQAPQLIKI